MFIEIFILSIIVGYLLKGRIANFDHRHYRKIYYVYFAFLIEFTMMILIKLGYLSRGYTTYILNFIMYTMLFLFIFNNRNNKWLVLIGLGFALNWIPIFFNNGAMPVSALAVVKSGLASSIGDISVSREGLYTIINDSTKFWFLGDIIPKPYLRPAVVSIGDIISGIGLLLLIITSMKSQSLD